MENHWIDELIKTREDLAQKAQRSRKLEEIRNGEAPLVALKCFRDELEKVVEEFNRKNPKQKLEQFECEQRSDDAVALVLKVDNSHAGQTTIYVDRKSSSLSVLYQCGGREEQKAFQFLPNADDGQVYLANDRNQQISTSRAVQEVFTTFIKMIPQ